MGSSGRRSWKAWTVSEATERPAKTRSNTGEVAMYVDITCPYCGDVFEATAASVSKNKSVVCLTHLKNKKCDQPKCTDNAEAEEQSVLALPPSKRNRTSLHVHASCEKRFAEMDTRITDLRHDVNWLTKKSTLYDHALTTVFPTLELPLRDGTAYMQLQTAVQHDVIERMAPALRIQEQTISMAPALLQDSVALRKRVNALVEENETLTQSLATMTEKYHKLLRREGIKRVVFRD